MNNLAKVAPSFLLTNPAAVNHLNGDLRALFLVNTPGPVHLTPQLLHALHVLRGRVEIAYESVKKGRGFVNTCSIIHTHSQFNTTPRSTHVDFSLVTAVCDDESEGKRRRESADSREDTGAKNDGDTSSKYETEEQKDESSGRQRWKSTSGILASSEDDDFGIKNRHSSTPGRNAAAAPGSAPFLESLASGSGGGGGSSVAEDHMARLRDAYSLFLTTSGMLVNMCKKNLGIDEEGVGVEAPSVADNSDGGYCGEEDGGGKDAPDAAKE